LKLRAVKFNLFFIGVSLFCLAQALTVEDFNQAAIVAVKQIPSCSTAQVSASVQLKIQQRKYFEQLTGNIKVSCAIPELRDLGRVTILRVTLADEQRVRESLRLKYNVTIERPVYYTKNRISKNTLMAPELLYIRTSNILAYAQDLVGPQNNLAEQYCVQDIDSDQPVLSWMIATKPLITTGETVSVAFYSEGIQLKMPGIALQDGRIGDKIRVQLNKTKKVFKVTIVGKDQYEVRL
jgi:flagella basal body P-ring formation protein FlgA